MMADIAAAAVSIKEEPLDDENSYLPDYGMQMTVKGVQMQQDIVSKRFFHADFKSMEEEDEDDDDDDDNDRLQILDEKEDVIIMKASNFTSKNELDFMEKLKRGQAVEACSKCEAVFDTCEDYKRHITSDRCSMTPKLYPCAKLCGCYFKTAEESKKHEKQEHSEKPTKVSRRNQIVAVKPTTTVRYKLKSQYLKKPEPESMAKRLKIEPTTVPFVENIKIKEEPIDDTIENMNTVSMTENSNIPLLPIKDEPVDYVENNEDVMPITKVKTECAAQLPQIKLEAGATQAQAQTDAALKLPQNLTLKLPPNLKVVPLPLTANNKYKTINMLPQQNIFNGFYQLPKTVKIVKINSPTQFVTLPANNANTSANIVKPITLIPCNIGNIAQPTGVLKFENYLPKNTKLQTIETLPTKMALKPANSNNDDKNKITNSSNLVAGKGGIIIKPLHLLKASDDNIKEQTIIAKPMLDKSKEFGVCNTRKIQVETKQKLRLIESEPQKRKIIHEMLNEIKKAEEYSCTPTSMFLKSANNEQSTAAVNSKNSSANSSQTASDQSFDNVSMNETLPLEVKIEQTESMDATTQVLIKEEPADEEAAKKPISLYLSITTTFDTELQAMQHEYPTYRFNWVCPYCPRLYEVKRAFRNHFRTKHGLTDEDLMDLSVELRPFPMQSKVKSSEPKTRVSQKATVNQQAAGSNGEESQSEQSAVNKRLKKSYTCTRCSRVFSSSGVLNDHLRANCSREPQYTCPSCSKRFYSASTLNCHLTIHTGELPHKCNFCDKRFRTRGQVTVHHRTHTGERPFECKICNQAFTHRETLIAHLSRHIGMKRYKCYGCNKHFSCISGLKTHRDKRPSTCGKVKFNPRAVGPRVRVIRGNVLFEPQPEINPYLRTEDPPEVLAEIQNQPQEE